MKKLIVTASVFVLALGVVFAQQNRPGTAPATPPAQNRPGTAPAAPATPAAPAATMQAEQPAQQMATPVVTQRQTLRITNRGIHEGTGVSFNPTVMQRNGRIVVRVTFNANEMTNIVVTSSSDTAQYLNQATTTMIPNMIRLQSANVDLVSGATGSSTGLREAVAAAIALATR